MVNWGNVLRCSCLTIPISFTIVSFLCAIFVLLGSTSNDPFPSDIYFLRLNMSGIGSLASGTLEETAAEALGLHDFYQTGLWNYCEGYYRADLDWVAYVTYCSPPTRSYFFDPISIISSELNPDYSIIFIQPEENAIELIRSNSAWLKATFVISSIFYGFTLVFGFLTGVWHERKIFNCIPIVSICFAMVFWLAGAITATNIYSSLRDVFSADIGLNVEGHMGRPMFTWIWLGFGFSCVAWFFWLSAAICCPGGHRKRRIDPKTPFPNPAPASDGNPPVPIPAPTPWSTSGGNRPVPMPVPVSWVASDGNLPVPVIPAPAPWLTTDGNPQVPMPVPAPWLTTDGNPPVPVLPAPAPWSTSDGNPPVPVPAPAPWITSDGNPPVPMPVPAPWLTTDGNPPVPVPPPAPWLTSDGTPPVPMPVPEPWLTSDGNPPVPVPAPAPWLTSDGNPPVPVPVPVIRYIRALGLWLGARVIGSHM